MHVLESWFIGQIQLTLVQKPAGIYELQNFDVSKSDVVHWTQVVGVIVMKYLLI